VIRAVTYYTVDCDGCGKNADEGGDYTAWGAEEDAWESADDAGYSLVSGKHYCEDCSHYCQDDEIAPGPRSECKSCHGVTS
jgi:hypothetical protein